MLELNGFLHLNDNPESVMSFTYYPATKMNNGREYFSLAFSNEGRVSSVLSVFMSVPQIEKLRQLADEAIIQARVAAQLAAANGTENGGAK